MNDSFYRTPRNQGVSSYGSVDNRTFPTSPPTDEKGQQQQQLQQPLLSNLSDVSESKKHPRSNEKHMDLLITLEKEIKFAKTAKFQIVVSRLSRLSSKRVSKLRSKVNHVNRSIGLTTTCCGGFCFSFFQNTFLFSIILNFLTILGLFIAIDANLYFGQSLFFGGEEEEEQEIINNKDTLVQTLFKVTIPFLAVAYGILGCLPSMFHRLDLFAQEVSSFASPSDVEKVAKEGIEDLMVLLLSRIDNIDAKVTMVVEEMKVLFDRANKHIYKLQMVDPDLDDIPDCSDMKEDIRKSKEELHASVLTFEQDIRLDVASWIPFELSSPRAFFYRDATKLVLMLAVLHTATAMGTIYLLEKYLPSDLEINAISDWTEYISSRLLYLEPLCDRLTPYAVCWIAAFIGESYIVSSMFLGHIYYGKTSCDRTASIINDLRSVICIHTNWLLLHNGILFLAKDILELRLSRIRNKMVVLMDRYQKIQEIMEMADLSPSSSVGDNKVVTGFPMHSQPNRGLYGYIVDRSSSRDVNETPNSVTSKDPPAEPAEGGDNKD